MDLPWHTLPARFPETDSPAGADHPHTTCIFIQVYNLLDISDFRTSLETYFATSIDGVRQLIENAREWSMSLDFQEEEE